MAQLPEVDLEATAILATLHTQCLNDAQSAISDPRPGITPNRGPKPSPSVQILKGPWSHQLKDSTILPTNIVSIRGASLSSGDFVAISLICDPKYQKRTAIFLGAVGAVTGNELIQCPGLKLSKSMLPGRTKGFLFRLKYSLITDGKETSSALSDHFSIWANAYQQGFPSKEHDMYIRERIAMRKKARKSHPPFPEEQVMMSTDSNA